jgi:hypothetical protein
MLNFHGNPLCRVDGTHNLNRTEKRGLGLSLRKQPDGGHSTQLECFCLLLHGIIQRIQKLMEKLCNVECSEGLNLSLQ